MKVNNISTRIIFGLIALLSLVIFVGTVNVKADTKTTVVLTYQDKVYTKELYGVDTDQIKNGVETDGLKSVGALCDNLSFVTSGGVSVDRKAVMAAVAEAIKAGKTNISIDLTKYTPEALKAAAVMNTAPVAVVSGLANAVANTANAQTVASAAEQMLINSTLNSIGIDTKIGEASTKFNPNQDRAVNVRNAASKINGIILQPGQAISANLAFGPRTVENGYGKGDVISGGEYVKAMGGGICQVSSTLNLAVLRSGIIPTERHNHSHRSSYIGSGLDATISSGTLDYQFVNTLAYPIYIATNSDKGVLTVSIYSNHNALNGMTFEPKVVGGKLSNTTYLVGSFNGAPISEVYCYKSSYKE